MIIGFAFTKSNLQALCVMERKMHELATRILAGSTELPTLNAHILQTKDRWFARDRIKRHKKTSPVTHERGF